MAISTGAGGGGAEMIGAGGANAAANMQIAHPPLPAGACDAGAFFGWLVRWHGGRLLWSALWSAAATVALPGAVRTTPRGCPGTTPANQTMANARTKMRRPRCLMERRSK